MIHNYTTFKKFANYSTVICLPIVLLLGCQSDRTSRPDSTLSPNDTIVPAIIRHIADLPDSLQPQEILMSGRRGPIEIPVPTKDDTITWVAPNGDLTVTPLAKPVTTTLPLLTNPDGTLVLGTDGQPIVSGTGGMAYFRHFTVEEGLALDALYTSLIDSKGNYWAGTVGGGLSRFDGQEFTNFNTTHGLAGNVIFSLMEDRRGHIWIGTEKGLSRYDGRSFKNYQEHGELKTTIREILEDDDGSLWIRADERGLIRFGREQGKGIEKVLAIYDSSNGLRHTTVHNLMKDAAGKVWMSHDGGLSRFDGEGFTHFAPEDGQGLLRVGRFLQDSSGKLLLDTQRGLYYFNPEVTSTPYPISKDTRLSGKEISTLYIASNGRLWIGTMKDGLHLFDGHEFTSYTTANGLANNTIRSIQEDKDGHIWVATEGGGISLLKDPVISNFTHAQGLPHIVWGLLEVLPGRYWLATNGGGIAKMEGGQITYYSYKQGLESDFSIDIYQDSLGILWVASYGGGLTLFDGKVFRTYGQDFHGLPSMDIFSIIPAAKGGYWLGTSNGLCRVNLNKDNKSIQSITNYTGALEFSYTYFVKEDKSGNLWVGTEDGLYYFDGNSFYLFNLAHGFLDEEVLVITIDSGGNLWAGTPSGLAFADANQVAEFVAGDLPGITFHCFTISDGLPDNVVIALLELPEGRIVAGTNHGIAIFDVPDGKELAYDKLHNLENFNTTTGYPIRDVNQGAKSLSLDSKGVLWIATGSNRTNLVRFDYRALNKNKKPVQANIRRLLLNEEPVAWSTIAAKNNPDSEVNPAYYELSIDEISNFGRVLNTVDRDAIKRRLDGVRFDSIMPFSFLPQNLVLPYRHNAVSFDFGSNELANPGMLEYQYKLDGYNREWSPALKQTRATFGNITEGTYTFRLKARFTGAGEPGSNDWSEEVSFVFRVLPPWYRSWWAYAIYLVMLGFLIWRVHLYQKFRTIRKVRDAAQARELAQAKEIEKAYSELKLTQQQLIQSEKMASLGELTAGIAHEIQNPLNFVNNFSEVSNELIDEMNEELNKGDIEEAKAISSDIKLNLEKINHHGKRADAIVKGMLEHSRTSSGEKVPTDINALCDEYLRLSYHGLRAKDKSFNAAFETDFDSDIPKINVLPQDLSRVLLNLINNAFYAVNEKANEGNAAYKPSVEVVTRKTEKGIEISVNDNGKGIPDHIKDKIFQPFFTTKPTGQGTGLGLSLSYDIVKAHGGEISIESHEGRGTKFIILLPI